MLPHASVALPLALAIPWFPVPVPPAPSAARVVPPGDGVVPPPRWYRGDTHVHVQLCGDPQPPDLTAETWLAVMIAEQMNVACVQLWGKNLTNEEFLDAYAPWITGVEDPITAGDPERVLQYGIEVSEFPAAQFGHAQALGIHDGAFPADATYTGPPLDFFRAQPGAITGFAHVVWSESYDPTEVPPHPDAGFAAPVEAALGKVDFVETPRAIVGHGFGWQGLFYKLLNAGLPVSVTGGRDNSCAGSDVVTYARIDAEPLTFDGWLEAIRAGRTSVSDGPHVFLDLEVEGEGLGGQVYVAGPTTLSVTAKLFVGPAVDLPGQASGLLRIVRDGVEVASAPYDLTGGGTVEVGFEIPVERSGWLAARAHRDVAVDGGAHTGVVHVFVAGEPVCSVADARYLESYARLLAKAVVAGELFDTGDDTAEVVAYIDDARRVFRALAGCDGAPPAGVEPFGTAQPSCAGPVYLGLDEPAVAGSEVTVHTLFAPPDGQGVLAVSAAANPNGEGLSGVPLYVDPAGALFSTPLASHAGGFAEATLSLGPGLAGQTLFLQSFWLDTPDCPNPLGGAGSASQGLGVTVQP